MMKSRPGTPYMVKRRKKRRTNGDGNIRRRNKKLILRAAIKVFARKGYDGTGIADIAAASGLPKANVYYYFKSKKAVYRAILDDLKEAWNLALAEIDAARDPAEALAGYIRAKLAYSRDHTEESKVFANEVVRGARHITAADSRGIREKTREREQVVEGWIEAGRMRPVDPQHLFIMMWAMTQFYADFEAMVRTTLGGRKVAAKDFARAEETIVGVILAGCGLAPPVATKRIKRAA
jgi:AcrR family transcriptional regulator